MVLSAHQCAVLGRYVAIVLEWNQRINLTRARTPEEAMRVLVVDALACMAFLPTQGTVVDLGAGAGTPGVPIAVVRPGLRVLLVEASRKKAAFLEILLRDLALADVDVLHARAESLGRMPAHRGRYDAVTARAVGGLSVLAEYALPLLRLGGVAVFPKSSRGWKEVTAGRGITVLGGSPEVYTLPAPVNSQVVVVRKIAATPEAYPRRPGIPGRRPL